MFVTSDIKEAQAFRREHRNQDLGFVPTMGFLHEGHLSLVHRSISENEITAVSIFVNPTQFNRADDLDAYPTDLKRDLALLEAAGVDLVFTPTPAIMYPEGFSTKVVLGGDSGGITNELEGAFRPGHFDGVTQVVCKLFHIISPEKAYFGMKDYQQLQVIRQMVEDLNFPLEIIPCPTGREQDGLAMSSRNVRLSNDARKQAVVLHQALEWARETATRGMNTQVLQNQMLAKIQTAPLAKVEYVACNHVATLQPLVNLEGEVLLSLAVFFGDVRLIDNIVLNLG